MRLRGHGASRPFAAAASLRRGARNAVVVLLLGPALAGCGSGGGVAPFGGSGGGVTPFVRFEVGENLGAVAIADGDAWVNDFGREQVLRIDGRSGQVIGRLSLGRRMALATVDGSVWALRWGGRFFRAPNGPILRIDPQTGKVTERHDLTGPGGEAMTGFGLVPSGSSLWVWGPDRVLELGAASGRLLRFLAVDQQYGELTGAAADGAGGLLATTGDGHLVRIGSTGIFPGHHEPGLSGSELQAVSGGRAFASRGGGVVAVSATSGRLLWRRQLGFRVSTILPHAGVLLVQGAAFRADGDGLWALDPATGRVLASATIPSFGTTAMALAGGSLWFTTAAGEVIVVPGLMTDLFIARAHAAR